ncbi:TraR/DksA family transcriptional regulator [Streptomyces justiciae]|uniref:TraR/DksA family transcriptional regulator n=1 Tax=Streptomyces justiciae TaxID=2780140 RepID=A0ABU3M7W1_9ACTN|nr:TraR/DksA family transcriptional regulator [Streptomyces justiciae]MDT7847607.1 TraR/DksA family transcriptional regulator [Streptomyces justiciae]
MVAKKTADQKSASGRSTHASGGAAKDVGGKKAVGAAAKKAAEKAAEGPVRPEAAAGSRKTAAKKTVTKKAAAKKTAETAAAVKKAAANKTAAAKKTAAKKAVGKKTAAVKSTTSKTTKSTSTKSAAAKSAAGKTAKKAGAAQAAKQTGATTVVAKKTPGTATAAKTAVPKARLAAAEPGELAVRPGEDPWTPEEVAEARAELQSEALRLRSEITTSEESLVGLMRDSGDGAGDDQADTGTKNITREHEMALAANAREMLEQTERALDRLDAGTYGLCENCGNPIGKARMQAFPRATLCVECKQKQERRY